MTSDVVSSWSGRANYRSSYSSIDLPERNFHQNWPKRFSITGLKTDRQTKYQTWIWFRLENETSDWIYNFFFFIKRLIKILSTYLELVTPHHSHHSWIHSLTNGLSSPLLMVLTLVESTFGPSLRSWWVTVTLWRGWEGSTVMARGS